MKKKVKIMIGIILGLAILTASWFGLPWVAWLFIEDVGGESVQISGFELQDGSLPSTQDYNAFPKAIITDEITTSGKNRTIVVWYNGDGHVDSNDDGKIMLASSDDEGATWTKPMIAYDDNQWDCRNIGLLKAPNGSLVMFFAKIDAYPESYADHSHKWIDFGFVKSYDHGRTWSEYISIINEPQYIAAGIASGNGYSDLALIGNEMYVMNYGYPLDYESNSHCGFLMKSINNGESWNLVSTLSLNEEVNSSESDIMAVSNDGNKIWGITRSQGDDPRLMYYFESNDRGMTWESLYSLKIAGDCPDLVRMSDGRILLSFRWSDCFNNWIGYTALPVDFESLSTQERINILQNIEVKPLIRTAFGTGRANMAYTSIHTISNSRLLVIYYDINAGGVFSRIVNESDI